MCFMELEKVKCCLPALTRCHPFVVLWAGPPNFFFFFGNHSFLCIVLHYAEDANMLLFTLLLIEEEDQLQSLHKN